MMATSFNTVRKLGKLLPDAGHGGDRRGEDFKSVGSDLNAQRASDLRALALVPEAVAQT